MDSTFIYPVTIHRGDASGSLTAGWTTSLPLNMSTTDERVAVLYTSEGKSAQGLYLKASNSSVWRFVVPYSAICLGIINGSTVNVYSNVVTADSGLPTSAKIWRNGIETDNPTFTVNDGAVYGAVTPPASGGGGSVDTVNGVSPDITGNVVIGIPQIPGLTAALAAAGQVKTVNGASPDGSGNVVVPVATGAVAGTVKGGGNVTIGLDGTLNAPTSSVTSVSGQVGAVVVQATNNNAASGTTLISDSGSTTGNIKLKTIVAGTNIALATDANGNLQINSNGSYTLPIASASILGGVKQGANVTIAGDGTLSVAAPYVLPVATNTVLGGVKQGANVAIAGDGTLSVAAPYVLPVATNSVLGGVKQGTNITIAGDGTISATAAPYTLPAATNSTLGGVIVKGGLTVDGSGNLSADVLSFNTRTGSITLQLMDILNAGGAPLASPVFSGTPTAPTPVSGDDSTNIATTAFVTSAIAAGAAGSIATFEFVATSGQTVFPATFSSGAVVEVFQNGGLLFTTDYSTNGGVGPVTLNTGATLSDEIKIIATSPFTVADAVPITGGSYTGIVQGLTASPGDNTTQFATTAFVTAAVSGISGVSSFNTRTGAVTLQLADVTGVGGAPLSSPALTGVPTAPTATAGTNTTQVATTAFVAAAVSAGGGVSSFNTRTGAVTLQLTDVTGVGGAPLASPTFTGTVAAPTPTAGDNSTKVATTAFVATSYAPLASPALTGTPTAPTATPGTNSTQLATTAFVTAAVSGSGVTSFNTRSGAVTLIAADVTGVGGALLASPAFTGTPTAPTATAGSNSTTLATTNYVYGATQSQTTVSLTNVNATLSAAQYSTPVIKLSGALTGNVVVTFPAPGNWDVFNNTTGAFTVTLSNGAGATVVIPQASTLGILSDATAGILSASSSGGAVVSVAGRTGAIVLAVADVSGAAPLASPALTGTPTAPTATAGDSSTKVATTAFVATSYAPLASPTLTGTPAAPTATAGTNTTQIATTAFVTAAVAAGTAGVTSFNTRTGAVTLQLTDVTGVGGAALASPTFTGTPAAPTATAGTNTTQIATTAFVATSYAPLASPALTGTPTAPTAAGGTNSTTLATTNYVYSATQGQTAVALTNANVTLSAAQYSNPSIKFTGTLTGNVVITFPTTGNWDVYNATTGAFTVTLSNGTGATVVIPQANTLGIMSDSTAGILSASSSGGAVTSVAGRTGAVTLAVADVSGAAPLASPTLTGTPVAPTATAGTNTTQIASTAYVVTALGSYAPLASPTFTGTPAAPTATAGTSTTQLATTAFVATSYAPLASPTFTGRVQADAESYTVTALGSVSGTQTLNLASASEWTMTITGATTLAFTNTLAANRGQVVYLRFTNAGSATITWPASTKFASGTAPTFTASGVDVVGVKYDTTTSTYMVFVIGLAVA